MACLLAVAVPAGLTMTTDVAQAQSSGGGRGGGGGGGGGTDGGGGGGDPARECIGGNCIVLTDCTDGQCGPTPPCAGDNCSNIPDVPEKVTYVKTPVGCQVKTCEIEGNKMRCFSHKAKDEKLCKKT